MTHTSRLENLESFVRDLLESSKEDLLFHGWHNVNFVRTKSRRFAAELQVDAFIVESAALVHDLNYVVKPGSMPQDGQSLREELLTKSGYTGDEQSRIEAIILEEDISTRGTNEISKEAQALSDADTLFKALPFTPILFTSKYCIENKVDIGQLASKIVKDQRPLLDQDLYFFTESAKRDYGEWALVNLRLWEGVEQALQDPEIAQVIEDAREAGVL